ncbi:hypothetical protein FB451DRAFT_1376451 [Mycena latifolia]|nr:hypothetical protein FB451DRAFT_1376451 [Mycena latifolia]
MLEYTEPQEDDLGIALGYIFATPALSTLYCFANLTGINIHSLLGFDLDDATVEQMARTWPRIQTLELESHSPRTSAPLSGAFTPLAGIAPPRVPPQ